VDDVNLKILACNLRRALRAPEECDIPWMLETAAREIDRLRILQTAADELDRLRVDARRLDWVQDHRVILVRARTRPCWKVESVDGQCLRPSLRDAIDVAMETMSDLPVSHVEDEFEPPDPSEDEP
jgi:hypothetical protein